MELSKDAAICNVCSLKFLPQTLTMVESLLKYGGDYDIHIFLSDVVEGEGSKLCLAYPNINFHFINQYASEQVLDNALLLSDIEFNTSLKAIALEYVLNTTALKTFYCDADLFFVHDLEYAIGLLDHHHIVITPHHINFGSDANDFMMCRTGVFNSGFIGAHGSTGLAFAQWWAKKSIAYCMLEPEEGLFVDQKWLDIAPALFDSVLALRHPGYNVAYWNIRDRGLNYETVFIHLSGLDPNIPIGVGDKISKFSDIKADQAFVSMVGSYFPNYLKHKDKIRTCFGQVDSTTLFNQLASRENILIHKRYYVKQFKLRFDEGKPVLRRRKKYLPYEIRRLFRTESVGIFVVRSMGSLLIMLRLGRVIELFLPLFRVMSRRNNWIK